MKPDAVDILLVEDEEAHAELIRRAFESASMAATLTVAGSLREARARLAESAPQLAIVDLLLPDGDGAELLPGEGKEASAPIVVITSHGDEHRAVEAMKAGALDYVVKSEAALADMPHTSERALREWRHLSERKRAEEALEKNARILRETGRMAKVGGWEVDVATHEVLWTEETCRIHEMPLDYKPPLDEAISFFHPEDRPKLRRAIDNAIEHGEPYDMELRLITATGKHLWTHSICKPYTSGGKTVKLAGTFQDITERKQAEERLRAYQKRLRSLASQLVRTAERERREIAVYLHDTIAQSLSLAVLKLGFLRDSAPSAGLRDDLTEVHDLIRQSVQEARGLIFDLSPPALYELSFQEAIRWLADRMTAAHNITITVEDDGQAKLTDLDSRVTLFRAIQELLTNVVKHARARQVDISVQRDDENIRIIVQDDGEGCHPDRIQPHAEANGGFGLFSIRESVAALGGQFEVYAEPEQGTRAILVVPITEEHAAVGGR